MSPVYTEIETARELRWRALSLERRASLDAFYGMTSAAERERWVAARMREMAVLVECAPFEHEGWDRVMAGLVEGWWAQRPRERSRRTLQSAVTRRVR